MPISGESITTQILTSPDPAAGSQITFTAPDDLVVHSLIFSFTTSATVANRLVGLTADDGTTIWWRGQPSISNQAASLTFIYTAWEGAVLSPTSFGVQMPLPINGLRLRKNDRIVTVCTAFDAGDNYTAMTVAAEFLT